MTSFFFWGGWEEKEQTRGEKVAEKEYGKVEGKENEAKHRQSGNKSHLHIVCNQ